MPISSIALVLLRLFALNWFLLGLSQNIGLAFQIWQQPIDYSLVVVACLYLLLGLFFWFLAPKLSRFVTKGGHGEFNLQGITTEQLYAAVFLGLGVYFTLDSFADVFSWGHFFAIYKSPNYGFHQQGNAPSYYDLSEALMTLAGGIVFIFNARRWAAKLCCEKETGST